MNHFRTERKAVYAAAKYFTECGWIFREQTVVDLGVDALVETPIDENGKINIFALQIKGGESNFQRKKNFLTFYFSERHYHYWNAISENHPLLIILQDNNSNKIYWQEYNHNFISKTSKNWKLDVPLKNILNEDSKEIILEKLIEFQYTKPTISAIPPFVQKKNDELTIYYSKSHEKKDTIIINIEYGKNTVTLDLSYKPKRKEWDREKSFLSWESQYHYSLIDFKRYIHLLFDTMNKNVLSFNKLVSEIKSIINNNIENVQEFIFNYNNRENDVPQYSDFLKAFELRSKLTRKQYEAQALDYIINIKTRKGNFEISSYQSLTEYLKNYIDDYSYSEIYTQTDKHIWSEIYIDAGIEKSKFIPVMQNELERYWRTLYKRIKDEIGRTEHLDKSKDESWRMFKTFIDLYNDSESIIELAYDFDEMVLYPIAVISMMQIFNADVCYGEYCELEFNTGKEWKSICIDDESWDAPFFYIRPYEI
ncbi:MAG: DUF4365 domain-containing protein [Bacteroidota bacterium]